MAAMDSLKSKIKEVRRHAADIEVRLSVPDGSVLSIEDLRAGIDDIIGALIEMAEVADIMERNYAASIQFLKQRRH